jgi:hypothetical protein
MRPLMPAKAEHRKRHAQEQAISPLILLAKAES